MEPTIPISYLDLLIAGVLVFASMALSWRLQLGLEKEMFWGVIRSFLQLSATGYVLLFVINRAGLGEWYWVLLALGIMLGVAVATAQGRIKEVLPGKVLVFTVAIVSGSMSVLLFVLMLVLHQYQPWLKAQYVLPLAGMITGNAMNAGAVAVHRFVGDLRSRRAEVETALALGATPEQAVHTLRRDALRTAIMPSVNGMLVVGVVSLPGMMTGQIIAGQDPLQAVHYQIMVVYMITAASMLTAVIAIIGTIRQSFTGAQQLR